MSSRRMRSLAVALAVTFAGSGCTGGEDPVLPLPGSGGVFDVEGYPEGPYGTDVGAVIKPYEFPGYANFALASGETDRITLSLADFYNPTGDAVFAADSPIAPGELKPRVLLINVGAVWCGPCQFEASKIIPEEYPGIKSHNGEILFVLADSAAVGESADFDNLNNWATAYEVNYPGAIDPSRQLGQLFDQSAFPANFLIDLTTMKIAELATGIPGESFWVQLEEVGEKVIEPE